MPRLTLGLFLLVCACGGSPADPFVGTWVGSGTVTITPKSVGAAVFTLNLAASQLVLAEDLNTGDVRFTECNWRGEVVGRRLELRQNLTPCLLVTSTASSCAATLTLFSGVLSVRGSSLSLDYGGAAETSACPGGDSGGSGTYSAHFDGARR